MRIAYFYFGEVRIAYGSAASMALNGHDVCVIEPDETLTAEEQTSLAVEVGVDGDAQSVMLPILKTPSAYSSSSLISLFHNPTPSLFEQVAATEPDALITSYQYFSLAKPIARRLNTPLMLVHIGFPTLFNLKEYWMARSFSRMLFSPAGFAFNLYAAHRSDCVLTTQLKTATIFRKFGVENVTNVLPTYTRFPHKDQYASFFEESRTTEEKVLPTDYVLAIISLARDARLYNYQLRGLDFLCEIAEKLKDIDFVVVGAARADVKEPFKYAHLKNVHLVGAVVDDAKLADIYRRAVCVVCSILAPSFPTRLFEAFFYAKAVISTPVALDCYVGLQDGSNILLATRPSEAADLVRRVFDEGELRARMEANARAYYVKLFSPLAHCRGLEEAYNSCCAHRAKGKVPQTTT